MRGQNIYLFIYYETDGHCISHLFSYTHRPIHILRESFQVLWHTDDGCLPTGIIHWGFMGILWIKIICIVI